MNPTTLKHDASDARTATTAGRNLAELIDRERAKGTAANPTWLRHAEASQAEWEGKARDANAALIRGRRAACRDRANPRRRGRYGRICPPST